MDRIRGDYNQYLKTYQKQAINKVDKGQATDQPAKTEKRDALELSSVTKEIKMAKEKIKELDQKQEERVKELKKAISQGTYYVSGRDIAEKMIEEAGFDREV